MFETSITSPQLQPPVSSSVDLWGARPQSVGIAAKKLSRGGGEVQ